MTDVVWVAFISAGAALVTALATQFLATRAASKQSDRAEKREALQWQRSEALRREELQHQTEMDALEWTRAEGLRRRAAHEARLKDLWLSLLETQNRMVDSLSKAGRGKLSIPAEQSATSAAAHVYAVALLGLPAMRQQGKAFYEATAKCEMAISDGLLHQTDVVRTWRVACDALEAAVVSAADQVLET